MKSSSNEFPQRDKDEQVTQKPAQSTVTCVYQTHIAGSWRSVTVIWSKNFMNYSLTISVESLDRGRVYICKIDPKPWHFWARKGYKSFVVDGNQVDVYWDFRSAKFSGSPEPCADFYVALVSKQELVLLLGDNEKKAYKKTKSSPAVMRAVMLYKKEHVFGKRAFPTRAKFDQTRQEHDIVVEFLISGSGEPEMQISVDGTVLIHICNLQWKFRGNDTVLVDNQPVHVFWDVHAWLFSPPGSSHGFFIFTPGTSEAESDVGDNIQDEESDYGTHSKCYSILSNSNTSQFCLFLYAWKIE
ncbi:uncharacterized protein LOC127262725 [Andrographis paniculata]|uniref:uncharacterized protein LOC127262725 n=1 Tax=Andrographis paniculata TaxID=175694 RepID=UPI0021E83EC3|nr:uncharacterized protein LOC127262725 [Andrographis paniculata]